MFEILLIFKDKTWIIFDCPFYHKLNPRLLTCQIKIIKKNFGLMRELYLNIISKYIMGIEKKLIKLII